MLQVRLDGEKLTMPAFLIASRAWAAAQKLLDLLEGNPLSRGGDPLMVTVSHGGSERQLTARAIAAATYVNSPT